MTAHASVREVVKAMVGGRGVLRLHPTWVPRAFAMPGRRLKLAAEDLYVLGSDRGGIDERWFASTTAADNGPGTAVDEGLSYVAGPDGSRFLLREVIAADPVATLGPAIASKYGRWPLYAKFFDNEGPLPHHIHHRRKDAAMVGREPKPEAYYFPPQLNQTLGSFPLTFFGLEPGTTRGDVRRCLERWALGDNGILELSSAYRLRPGTGWLVPPGILHAPGSLCTFEVQWGSDVFAMFQSMVDGRSVGWDLLVKDVPEPHRHDLDFIVELIDWDANLDPSFKEHHYLEPRVTADTSGAGYQDRWVIYGLIDGEDKFAARELTVSPGASLVLRDQGSSGVVVVQGCGQIGGHVAQASTSVRFGQPTADEFFFTAAAATAGIEITNTGQDDLVLLRYFGPGVNGNMPKMSED